MKIINNNGNMKDISIIIPMHVFDEDSIQLLNTAIKSVPTDLPILLSCKMIRT